MSSGLYKTLGSIPLMSIRKNRVSIAMALDEIKEVVENIEDTRRTLQELLTLRNQLMVELKAAQISERAIMKLTGLSRDAVSKITSGAKHDAALRIEEMLERPSSAYRPLKPSQVGAVAPKGVSGA